LIALRRRLTISYTVLVGSFILLVAVAAAVVAFAVMARQVADAISGGALEGRAIVASAPQISVDAVAARIRRDVERADVDVYVAHPPGGLFGFGGPPGGGPFGRSGPPGTPGAGPPGPEARSVRVRRAVFLFGRSSGSPTRAASSSSSATLRSRSFPIARCSIYAVANSSRSRRSPPCSASSLRG